MYRVTVIHNMRRVAQGQTGITNLNSAAQLRAAAETVCEAAGRDLPAGAKVLIEEAFGRLWITRKEVVL